MQKAMTFHVWELFLNLPEDFARVVSPKMMPYCHMLRMNVCDTGRHAGTQRHKKGLTFLRVRAWLARALDVQNRLFVTQTGRQAETRKRVEIYKSVGCDDPLVFLTETAY